MANKFGFGLAIKRYILLTRRMPRVAATIGVNFSKKAFRNQGWTDKGLQKWDRRKGGQKRNKRRSILVDSGDLKKSVKIISLGHGRARIGSDLVYAPVHNFGLKAGRKSRRFKMPKRQFIGKSDKLEKEINTAITVALGTIFK